MMIGRLPLRPTFLRLLLLELLIEVLLMEVAYVIMVSEGVPILLGLVPPPDPTYIYYAMREFKSGVMALPFVFIGFRIWNQLPVCWVIRCYAVKRLGRFDMRHTLAIILPVYLFFYILIMMHGMHNDLVYLWKPIPEYELPGLWSRFELGIYACAAALIAPLLTYRLTGYVLECDFRLPRWSHGKWGFGKPSTQAKDDYTA